jgi:hypothetical protein
MEADAATVVDQVEAALNYLKPGIDHPFVYAYDAPPGMPQRNIEYQPRRVLVRNARPIAPELSLDKQGFLLRAHRSDVVDFYDDGEVRRVYYPEIEKLVRETTGAEKVVIFDHTRRNSNTPLGEGNGHAREAAAAVHNDYTDKSAPQRVRDLLEPAEAEARLERRYLEINVWRSIAQTPVAAWPLALGDARSIDDADLVASERRYPDRVGEIYHVAYNPRHRWFYFPEMRRDEALFIKCFDSAKDGRARLSVHSAFEDPTTPPGAPPRESVEVRTFAFF